MPKLKRPMPSLLEPAPKRFLTKVCRPLSTRQMIEMAVRSGKGYCGILHVAVSHGPNFPCRHNYTPFPEEDRGEHDPEVTAVQKGI